MTDSSGRLRITLLGRVGIHFGDVTVDDRALGGAQAQLVFAALVLERARQLPRDELAEIVWPGELPSAWESALRTLISRVRAFLVSVGLPGDETLVGTRTGYQLHLPDDVVVDAELGDPASLARPLLPGVDNPWLDRWRARVAEALVQACEAQAEARLANGDARGAVAAAEQAVAAAPFRESAFRVLMRAHAAGGNRAEALRAYERCRRMLADELGVNPSPETEAVYVALLGDEPAAAVAPIAPLSSGTVTFLFTDIEGSATRWDQDAEAMTIALARHDRLLNDAVESHRGRVFKHTGDGICAVFASASEAVAAAVTAQQQISATAWGPPGPLRVRVGVHTGEAEVRGDDYAGVALSRIARLCALAGGGQILVSSSTRLVVDGRLPEPVSLRYLAEVELRGMAGTEAVYQVVHPNLPADFPPVHTGHRQGTGLAVDDSPLIGREADLADVRAALAGARLVTITGVGGVGKTRLALAAAHIESRTYGDRTWWIELATVDADAVAYAVANVVGGARQGVDALTATMAKLEVAPAFLVLDNCEHVVAEARAVITPLLARCPDLRVLATSRAALEIAGEQLVVLAPLAAPSEGASFADVAASPSVEVFLRRAQAASRGFELTPANADAVADICRRLDGLPLALELAAARVRSIPPAEIARHLDERFRLLRGAHRDATGRERRLEDVVRWSHELLSPEERELFDRLSVFAGSFTVEAVAAVADLEILDASELLDGLVGRSMLTVVEDDTFARYGILETMRAFGRARLDAARATAGPLDGHRRYYVHLAESAAAGLQGPAEARWVRVLHADFANLRAAFIRAAAEGDIDTCARIVVALFDYAFFRMRREVGLWAAETVSLAGAPEHPLYGLASAVAGYLAWERGALDDAIHHTTVAVDADATWLAYDALGTIRLFQGRVDDAREAYAKAVDIADASSNRYLGALALGQLAFAYVFATEDGAEERALEFAAAAVATARESGNPTANAHSSWAMGIALFDRDPAGALEDLAYCMEVSREVDNRMSLGAAATPAEELRTKLSRRTVADDLRAALEHIDYWVTAGNTPNFWGTVRRVARDFAALGSPAWAAVALGADAEASLKLPLREREQARHEAVVAEVRAALGPDGFAEQAARGAAISPAELVSQLRAAVADRGGPDDRSTS
jgi:predicted ATPase/class 3 adenylate cyclase